MQSLWPIVSKGKLGCCTRYMQANTIFIFRFWPPQASDQAISLLQVTFSCIYILRQDTISWGSREAMPSCQIYMYACSEVRFWIPRFKTLKCRSLYALLVVIFGSGKTFCKSNEITWTSPVFPSSTSSCQMAVVFSACLWCSSYSAFKWARIALFSTFGFDSSATFCTFKRSHFLQVSYLGDLNFRLNSLQNTLLYVFMLTQCQASPLSWFSGSCFFFQFCLCTFHTFLMYLNG